VKTHDYEKYAAEYADLGFEGTVYLAFRDIPALIKKYVNGTKALDYGCGSGRSTRLLKKLGFDALGVDISKAMLQQASSRAADEAYHHIVSGELPFDDASFDLVFSSYVFLEVPSISEIEKILKEVKRVLKPDGHVIFITTSEAGYKGDWVSLSFDFPENKRLLASGDKVKLNLRGSTIFLYDYYWAHEDFLGVFTRSGLTLRELHQPLGLESESIEWRDEMQASPVSIYVLQNQV